MYCARGDLYSYMRWVFFMNKPDFSQKINAKAFERNTKPKPIINKQKNPVSQAELASSPWGKLTFFS